MFEKRIIHSIVYPSFEARATDFKPSKTTALGENSREERDYASHDSVEIGNFCVVPVRMCEYLLWVGSSDILPAFSFDSTE